MSRCTTPLELPTLALFRHGETQWNRVGRYQGHQDSPLTLTGIGQVRAAARSVQPHLGDLSRYCIWSSPLPRTRQSVSILCEELGLPFANVTFDDRLMERGYGRWEGLTLDQITARYPEDVAQEKADRWTFAIPDGGESFATVAKRLRDWLSDLPNDESVMVMAHGGSGRVLRGLCSGLTPEDIFAFNDPQSSAFLITKSHAQTIPAKQEALLKFGCADSGLGVRI